MLKYTIIATLFDAETEENYTEFRQSVFDSYNADEFSNVIEMFNELIAFCKANFDCEDTYELSAYILNENNEAIY
jgi:hypothetical protein